MFEKRISTGFLQACGVFSIFFGFGLRVDGKSLIGPLPIPPSPSALPNSRDSSLHSPLPLIVPSSPALPESRNFSSDNLPPFFSPLSHTDFRQAVPPPITGVLDLKIE